MPQCFKFIKMYQTKDDELNFQHNEDLKSLLN